MRYKPQLRIKHHVFEGPICPISKINCQNIIAQMQCSFVELIELYIYIFWRKTNGRFSCASIRRAAVLRLAWDVAVLECSYENLSPVPQALKHSHENLSSVPQALPCWILDAVISLENRVQATGWIKFQLKWPCIEPQWHRTKNPIGQLRLGFLQQTPGASCQR